jgi:hypothetical protein
MFQRAKKTLVRGNRNGGRKVIDILGQTFGRWTVVAPAGRQHHEAYWFADCACGNQKIVSAYSLRSGRSKSCGNCGPAFFEHNGIDGDFSSPQSSRRIKIKTP